MKKREFNKVMKQLIDKETERLSLEKIAALDVDTRDEIVHYLVRYRYPIVKDFISPDISWEWLHAMGYLYEMAGKDFTFVYLAEHKIK